MTNKIKTKIISELVFNGYSDTLSVEHTRCQREGVLVDLSNQNIAIPILEDVTLTDVDLSGSVISKSMLSKVSFINSVLDGCIFVDCKLNEVDMSYSKATGMCIKNSKFINSCIYKTTFNKAQFDNSIIRRNVIINCNLRHTYFLNSPTKYNLFKHCDLEGLDYNTSIDLDTNIFYKCEETPLALSVDEGILEIKKLKKRLRAADRSNIEDDEGTDEDLITNKVSTWSEMPDFEDDY